MRLAVGEPRSEIRTPDLRAPLHSPDALPINDSPTPNFLALARTEFAMFQPTVESEIKQSRARPCSR